MTHRLNVPPVGTRTWLRPVVHLAFCLGVNYALFACDGHADWSKMGVELGSDVRSGIGTMTTLRVFFSHQSVGQNIVEGLEALRKESGAELRIIDATERAGHWPLEPGLWHARLGSNGKPETKIDAFAEAFRTWVGQKPQVAMLKLCYVDVTEETNIPRLLDHYRVTINQLKSEFPETVFGHVTVPLAPPPDSLKAVVKRSIGRRIEEDSSNAARTRFNRSIRELFSGDPILDLEQVESTRPDGTRIQLSVDRETAFGLARELASDQWGHLNALGARLAAKRAVTFVVDAARRGKVAS